MNQLFKGEVITIGACDGSRFISTATRTFSIGVDKEFARWDLDKRRSATLATNVSVYEQIERVTFVQMFGSLNSHFDKLAFTQDQIIEFCEKHRSRLRKDGYSTFFLFKEDDQFFVARVNEFTNGLYAIFYRLDYGDAWSAGYRYRVVVPQLNT
jgi:hypothetical protein